MPISKNTQLNQDLQVGRGGQHIKEIQQASIIGTIELKVLGAVV